MNYTLAPNTPPAIPLDATVLVTGVSGYIGSHVADQLLLAGYRVRGTVRDEAKGETVRELFAGKYGNDRITTVVVADMSIPGAYDEACQGVSAIAHVASDVSFTPDPNAVIPGTIAGAINALSAAAKEPAVKRVVFTSSGVAMVIARVNEEFTITTSDWNDSAVEKAWAPPPYEPERSLAVYAASKTQAERAMWAFMREKKPGFVLNAVLPDVNMGTILSEKLSVSSGGSVKATYEKGEVGGVVEWLGPQWMVDVQDTARLHVAALIDPDVEGQRILAFAHPFNWNDVLACLRKLDPGKSLPDDIEGLGRDLSRLDNGPGAELLKKFGRSGWTSLEESVKNNAGL